MPEELKEPTKEGFKLQWAESDGQASAQSLDKEHTNIEATTPEKRHHIINEVSYTTKKPIKDITCTKTQPMNEISYTKREPANEANARMQGKSMVTQSSSNHVPIEVTNTEKSTDTRMRNGTSTMGILSITKNQQDHIIHQPIQTEDCNPDDMESTKTKKSAFESSSDIRPKHNNWENNINLLLATNSCMSHPAPEYRPRTEMLGHEVKLPPNLLEHYPKPGKPPDDYRYIMAMRDHNTMVGERQYEGRDQLMKIRCDSKFDPGPFTITGGLGPAFYRIRSQKNRVAHDQLGLTVEGTPKWVESN